MEWCDIEVDGEHTVKFADLPYVPLLSPTQTSSRNGEDQHNIGQKLGGIMRQGEWSWLARNSMLQIVSLRNGQTISSYEFCESNGYDSCYIRCVDEIYPNNPDIMLLAVVLENFRGGPGGFGGSYVVLYSVELSSVLSSIELSLHATCARFMDANACRRSLLQNFDGCLALGSEEGVVILLDLNIRKINAMQSEIKDATFVPCHIVDSSLPLTEIHRNFRQCQQDGIHFGLQMEVIESPCSIQCILPIDLIMAIAIGLEDGRMALYDLAELQIFYVAIPKRDIAMSALVKMDYLEPPDDPRPCLYIWTLHENGENLHAVMHNLMYEKRFIEEDDDEEKSNKYFIESFKTCSVRLQLPLEATKSVALACQAISTLSSHGEDDSNCLCAISWFSVLEEKNKLLIFDLNQWYKEEMPFALEFDQQPSYLAGYILNGQCTGLNMQLQPNTIAHFNSIQRFEEHFYPNSLSFDCSLLHADGCRRYNWEGAQNKIINLLRVSNAAIFLEPNNCFNEIMKARLMPQFTELNMNSTFSKNAKYDIILSTALENNCVSLLRDCAKSWIDGSFLGDFAVSTGLSLSTLTEWIWQRATAIKSRCNDLCKGLFEFGGYPLDNREQKELGFITRQLKLLYDLMGEILVQAKRQIPGRVYSSLENNHNSLRMASNYQDILLWLLNIGLLPEASPYNAKVNATHDLIPYPYKALKDMYKKKRLYFSKINDNFISKKSGSCRLLYIDAFIDHACKGNVLHEFWLENDGDGLYPPNSIEAMLRVMLVPELEYEDKYAILLYFFLDLNMAIDEDVYKGVVSNFIKFPSVFKLSAALIKTVQSFWNLDHDQYLPAVDEFISPFNKHQIYPQWMVELLIESLLTQNAANLALRILESQPSLISPVLKLKTLLANELIAEAFHFVRSNNDDSLLETFFSFCLRDGQFGVIRDLALNEREGLILQSILKRSKSPGAESLHFVYLLQKSKYIDAVAYMDELSSKTKTMRSSLQHQHAGHMDTPNMVLSAFNTTMTPVTQGLTDVYFRIKNKIKKKEVNNKSPVPLSCQLIKQNANSLLGGIYHSSALSAHFATYYWGELEEQRQNEEKHLLSCNNAPFLRRPQIEAGYMDSSATNSLSYPQAYRPSEKRTLVESEVLENAEDQLERQRMENQQNPKKKRRLIGQEIVDDLSHFMNLNKQRSINLNINDFRFNEEHQATNDDESSVNSMEMLTRPPLATNQYKKSQQESSSVAAKPEIQGILKTNTPDSQAHLQEEEKYLRFRLPSIDMNNSPKHIPEEDEAEVDIEEMDIVEHVEKEPQSLSDLTAAKESSERIIQITRAVSVESSKSAVSSGTSSEENFYSPLSSQNNSKLDCSNISRSSVLSGPKARKPLARLSSEKDDAPIKRISIESEPVASIIREPTPKPINALSAERAETNETKSREHSPKLKPDVTNEENTNESKVDNVDMSTAEYVTAVGGNILNISSRKSLESVSKDMETTDQTTYITAINTQTSTSNAKIEISQTSSGFGSVSARSTLTSSKITEFIPKVSSSKVGSTPVKAEIPIEKKPQSPAKLSECTTVLGSFDYTSSGSNNVFAMPSKPAEKSKTTEIENHTEEQKRQMLETTLGMSSYDISVLDSTSLQPTKSSLMVTANDKETSSDENAPAKEEDFKSNAIAETEEAINPLECNEEQIQVFEVSVAPEEDFNELDTEDEDEEPSAWGDLMNSSDDDCIVLSSSSSYIDDNDYGRPFDFRSSDDSDDESRLNGAAGHADSEKSFDTGDYDDYDEDMVETEVDSMDVSNKSSNTESNDVIQLIDDTSSEACTDSNSIEQSATGDKSSLSSSSTTNSNKDIVQQEKDVQQVICATTTNNEAKAATTKIEIQTKQTASIIATTSSVDDGQKEENITISSDNISKEQESKHEQKEATKEIRESEEVEITKPQSVKVDSDLGKKLAENTSQSTQSPLKHKATKHKQKEASKEIRESEEVEVTKPQSVKVDSDLGKTLSENTAQSTQSPSKDKATKHEQKEASKEVVEREVVEVTKSQSLKVNSDSGKKLSEIASQSTLSPSKDKATKHEQKEASKQVVETEVAAVTKSQSVKVDSDSGKTLSEIAAQRTQLPSKEIADIGKDLKANEEIKETAETAASLEPVEAEEQFTLKIEEGDSIDSTDVENVSNNKVAVVEEVKENVAHEKSNKPEEEAKTVEAVVDSSEDALIGKPRNLRRTSKSAVDLETTIISSPRRNTRGTSVPPLELDIKTQLIASPRRNTRGTSIPPTGVESLASVRESERSSSIPPAAVETHVNKASTGQSEKNNTSINPVVIEPKVSTPSARQSLREATIPTSDNEVKASTRRSLRGTSVPHFDLEPVVTTPRRNTRGISVPPQTIQTTESEGILNTPSRTRRSVRATSLQPADLEGTPRKREKVGEDTENNEILGELAVSAVASTGKAPTRRRSVLLDAIYEDGTSQDSPSAHTRFRSRINSMESEADQSLVSSEHQSQSKRTRKTSLSSTSAAALALTPKRARRSSISSQSESGNVLTPRTLRGRSILAVVDDESESIPPSPKPATERRIATGKRRFSVDEHSNASATKSEDGGGDAPDETSGKKIESPKEDSTLYSTTSRRLTRTQLAIMEKSVALAKHATADAYPKESNISPPATTKRTTKARSTRSTAHDSDDTESITSKLSTTSSAATTSKRRVTRKNLKDKEEDDGTSIASSVGSEKNPKLRRSKDKSSPISTLPAIPEDAPVETKKRSRNSAKH